MYLKPHSALSEPLTQMYMFIICCKLHDTFTLPSTTQAGQSYKNIDLRVMQQASWFFSTPTEN